METIKAYLENMFHALPKTAELEKAKTRLLESMEDKYHELKGEGKTENEAIGIVISEFGNVEELCEELGLEQGAAAEPEFPLVSEEEAESFLRVKRFYGLLVAIGAALCVMSPFFLIITGTGDPLEAGPIAGSSAFTSGLSLAWLLVSVAVAVGLFIFSGMKMDQYKYMENPIVLEPQSKARLTQEYKAFLPKFTAAIAIGVILCILSPLPLIVCACFGASDLVVLRMVGMLLFIVALAVVLFVRFGNLHEAYQRLLQIEEYTVERKKHGKVLGAVGSVVWPIAVAVFLVWGFAFDGWQISWVIFPVVGILYGGFCALYNAVKSND